MEITPKFTWLGLEFDLTVLIGTLLSAIIVLVFMLVATRKLEMVPRGLQTVVEMMVDFARGLAEMGHDEKRAHKFVGFTLTLLLFILVANQIGVILMVTSGPDTHIPALGITHEAMEAANAHGVSWLKSPTADMAFAFTLSISVAIGGTILAIIFNGFGGWLKGFVSPMAPLHILEAFINPVTHAMRLWANIFAGEILITILLQGMWWTSIPLAAWIGFSLFVGTMQAYIFTVLANVYIGQKISH